MSISLIPDYTYASVYDIEYSRFKENGIRALIFDIDNTLASYDTARPDKELKQLFERLTGDGFQLYFLSNNDKKRVTAFAENTGIMHRWRALKPLGFFIRRAMKKMNVTCRETALVGDQLFTDILGANIAGLTSVLVQPVSEENEDRFVAFKRKFEKMAIKNSREKRS